MQSRFAHRARRSLIACIAVFAVGLVALPAVADARARNVTVMTRNLYLGSGLDNLIGTSGFAFILGVTTDWSNVVANDFPTRANALAAEIAQTKPDLVGLQEVSLWRDGPPDSLAGGVPPNSTNVVYDFLGLLQTALNARGLHYSAAATSVNADVEAPRLDPGGPFGNFRDIRLTDRDVILKNNDNSALTVGAGHDGHYGAQLSLPVGGGSAEFTRGWTYVDANVGGDHPFRFFNTH